MHDGEHNYSLATLHKNMQRQIQAHERKTGAQTLPVWIISEDSCNFPPLEDFTELEDCESKPCITLPEAEDSS
jgi:hypothetical protein